MAKCLPSAERISARCWQKTSATSSLLFCLSFALNGYFNDAAVYSFPLAFTVTQRGRKRRWEQQNGENKKAKEVMGNDYLRKWERCQESKERLTRRFLTSGAISCCSLHFCHLENELKWIQDRWFYHQWWELRAGLFDQSWPGLHIEESSHQKW